MSFASFLITKIIRLNKQAALTTMMEAWVKKSGSMENQIHSFRNDCNDKRRGKVRILPKAIPALSITVREPPMGWFYSSERTSPAARLIK